MLGRSSLVMIHDPTAALKAEAILTRMENNPEVIQNTISYNSIFNCYAKSSSADAGERAESLLGPTQYFHSKWINTKAKLDGFSYNTVIMA